MSETVNRRRRGLALASAAAAVLLTLSTPDRADAQQTIDACYVPDVGALYLVGLPGLPAACLSASHQAISWTAGAGSLEDGSVTAVKLADGSVVTVKLADGAVTPAKLGFDPATQAELDAHAGSADHDGRYFTEAELTAAGTLNATSNPVDWTRLKGVPAGFADGVDDGSSYTAGAGLALVGSEFRLSTSGCAAGDLWKWTGSSWACDPDLTGGTGTVTSVSAGTGLTGGTITTSGSLAVDFSGPGTAGTAARSDHTHEAGFLNTKVGAGALAASSGGGNTALGANALAGNGIGGENTAVGAGAMTANSGGSQNTAVGVTALASSLGDGNTAIGWSALYGNTYGVANTAVGKHALRSNTAAGSNTAVGFQALFNANGGSDNIALGADAGSEVTTGSNNIHIGTIGTSSDDGVIRIGTAPSHTATYVAGIAGATATGGVAVVVNSAGKLGTLSSSIRFKESVEDLGGVSRGVYDLRPVRFRYRPEFDDGSRLVQYGLIAEEVEAVFPELVVHDEAGRVQTVRYHLLPVLLLNEIQRQEAELEELRGLRGEVDALRAALDELRATAGATGGTEGR